MESAVLEIAIPMRCGQGQIIQATGRGAVITWNSTPTDRRHPARLTVLRQSMVAAVTALS